MTAAVPEGKGLVFRNRPNGAEILGNDQQKLYWLSARLADFSETAERGYVHKTKFPSLVDGQKVQYQYRLGLPYSLSPRLRHFLEEQGGRPFDQAPARPDIPSHTGHSNSSTASPTSRRQSQNTAASIQSWNENVQRWLTRTSGIVKKSFQPLTIPHPELRQLIRRGLYLDAERLIQELLSLDQVEISQLVRYQIWLEHAQGHWNEAVAIYEENREAMPTGAYLALVAEAYLEAGQTTQAATLLRPLVEQAYPHATNATHFLLAARLHAVIGEHEAARATLRRLWMVLTPEQQAEFESQRQAVEVALPPENLSAPTQAVALPSHEDQMISWRERLTSQPASVYLEMQAQVSEASGAYEQLLLAQAAEQSGAFAAAQELFTRLWQARAQAPAEVIDQVVKSLIYAAWLQNQMAEVTYYREAWPHLAANADLLSMVAQAYQAQEKRNQAADYYRLAYEHGARQSGTLRFLAEHALEQFGNAETSDMRHLMRADAYYTELLASGENTTQSLALQQDFTPEDAQNWLIILQELDEPQKMQKIFEKLLGGLELDQFNQWQDVLKERLNIVLMAQQPPASIARAAADYLLAAEGTVPAQMLVNDLERVTKRLQGTPELLDLLEEAEALPSLTKVVGTVASTLAIEMLNAPTKRNSAVLRRLKLLIYSAEGVENYQTIEKLDAEHQALVAQNLIEQDPEEVSPLAGKRICLVGGHENWQKRAEDELIKFYDVAEVTFVPATWDANLNEKNIAQRTQGRDLVLIMWRTMKHASFDLLQKLLKVGTLEPSKVQYVAGTGGKSFVREAERYFRAQESLTL